jgi:hypothetical protein
MPSAFMTCEPESNDWRDPKPRDVVALRRPGRFSQPDQIVIQRRSSLLINASNRGSPTKR